MVFDKFVEDLGKLIKLTIWEKIINKMNFMGKKK